MVLNLAGFRIKLDIHESMECPRLSLQHASLLSKGPEDFRLRVHYCDHVSTEKTWMEYPPGSWSADYFQPQVRLMGTWRHPHGGPWEMILDASKGTGSIRIPRDFRAIDPLAYPVDALLIYYLSLLNQAIILHASGVDFNGCGLLFTGLSGAGKTTIARFCQMAGARILHDDRILVRVIDHSVKAFRMPVYPGSLPSSMDLSRIYFLEKSVNTYEIPQPVQIAFERLSTHAVQHPFSQ